LPGCAFDTNVLAYAAGIGRSAADRSKVAMADALLAEVVATEQLVLPVQVCLELHHLLVRKRGLSSAKAAELVRDYSDGALIVASDLEVLELAFELADRHRLQTYDSVIVASAAHAGCAILFSEDMQHGFEWQGVTIVNPFA
jgi:predicted nucleic acid-binding protein